MIPGPEWAAITGAKSVSSISSSCNRSSASARLPQDPRYTYPAMSTALTLEDRRNTTGGPLTHTLTLDANGDKLAGLRYTAWGAVRHADGVTPTPYTFTGQYSHMAQFGLMFFNARWLDPALGRFAQADTIVPGVGNPQTWDRFAYSLNNPVRNIDPSGHLSEDQIEEYFGVSTWEEVIALFEEGGRLEGRWGWLEALRKAKLGDEIGWYGEYDWFSETPYDSELYRGTLTEIDGQLYLESNSGLLSIFDAAIRGDNIFVDNGRGRTYFSAESKYYHLKFKGQGDIDKVDLGVDIFGILGDLAFLFPPGGTAVWVVSEIPEFLTLGKTWDQLDMGDPSGVIIDTTTSIAQIARLVPEGGFIGNIVSLAVNLLEISP